MAVIGIDLGGTKLSGAIFNKDGGIIKKEIFFIEKREGDEAGSLILFLIQKLLYHASLENIPVNALGCCVPGAVTSGNVWAPNIPGWENYPLQEKIEKFLNEKKIIINIDSDRSCSILGEVWLGAAKGCKNAIFLAVGTGIGAGIFADGRIIRGEHDIAGAIGWLALNKPYREKYIPCGCFEYHSSGDGLARIALEKTSTQKDYSGPFRITGNEPITAHDVFKAYESGDPIASEVLNEAIEYWGMAAANLVSIFNPEKIIFGGGVFGPAIQFLDKIRSEAEKWAQPISMGQVSFVGSQLGSDAALYGSAFLAVMNENQA